MSAISASKLLLPAGSTLAKGLDGTLYLINQPVGQNIVTNANSTQPATQQVVIGNTLNVATPAITSVPTNLQSLLGTATVSTVASASVSGKSTLDVTSGQNSSGTLTAALIDRGSGGKQIILLPSNYQLANTSTSSTSTVSNVVVRNPVTQATKILYPSTIASNVKIITNSARNKQSSPTFATAISSRSLTTNNPSPDEVINIEPDIEGSVPDIGSVQSISPPEKTSPSKGYKTVQVSMNGVVQTLLVPEVPGEEMNSAVVETIGSSANGSNVPDTGQPVGLSDTASSGQKTKSNYSTDAHSAPPPASQSILHRGNIKSIMNKGANYVVMQPNLASKVLTQISQHAKQAAPVGKTTPNILSTPKPLLRKALNQGPREKQTAPSNVVGNDDAIKISSVFSLSTATDEFCSKPSTKPIPEKAEQDMKVDISSSSDGKVNQRAKRKATTNSPICRNCPGCKIDPKKRTQVKKTKLEDTCNKYMTVPLTAIRTGGKKSIAMRRVRKLNPNLFKGEKASRVSPKMVFAVKSTAKRAQALSSKIPDSGKLAPLNFSKYYLVKSPAGTFLVPREADNASGDSSALFRVVTYNTGRAVAIRTPEGVQKMFVEAMDSSESPPLSVNERLWKQVSKKSAEEDSTLNIKPDPDGAENKKRRRTQIGSSSPTDVLDSDHDSDTDSAPEANKTPEPTESAGDRVKRLKEMLKQQEAQLAEMRSKTEDAKRVLAEMDEDVE